MGYSPYQLIYGNNVRIPFDILYEGWRNRKVRSLNVDDWVDNLCIRLEVMWEAVVEKSLEESKKRKRRYDRGSSERSFRVGGSVLARIPGMIAKLQDSLVGPYIILDSLNSVNYRNAEKGFKSKNQRLIGRELEMRSLTVV